MTRSSSGRPGSGWWRRPTIILGLAWIALTGSLVAVGLLVVHSGPIWHFDRTITSDVVSNRTEALDTAMKVVTWLGSWLAVAGAGAVVMVLCAVGRLPWGGFALAVVAWAGQYSGTTIAKYVVDRPRPPRTVWLMEAHGASFPSGHAASAALVWPGLAVVVALLANRRCWRIVGWVMAALVVVAVGFSRIELGVHWTTDVLGSFAFVGLWLLAVAVTIRAFASFLLPSPPMGGDVRHPRRRGRD